MISYEIPLPSTSRKDYRGVQFASPLLVFVRVCLMKRSLQNYQPDTREGMGAGGGRKGDGYTVVHG